MEEGFEEPYFEKNLKLNRKSQINSEKNYNDHDNYNRPPPELPPPNSKSTRQILMNKNIVQCRDQLTIRKDNYVYFVTTNGIPRDNGSRSLEQRGTLPKFKNLQKGTAKEIKKGNYYHFALPIFWKEIKLIFDLVFANSLTKIIICNGITQYPTKEQRSQLIEEAHSSELGGHKGATKTYNRIRQNFFWKNMKVDIQKYIQGCLQCQKKN